MTRIQKGLAALTVILVVGCRSESESLHAKAQTIEEQQRQIQSLKASNEALNAENAALKNQLRLAAPETSDLGSLQSLSPNIYVVKPGDSLAKIAVTQCGSVNAVTTIRELNKDVLKDIDVIEVGMKLRLPRTQATTRREKE